MATEKKFKDIFRTVGNSIYANMDVTIKIENSNCLITEEGNVDALLFGSVIVATNKNGESEVRTITLGTRVLMPIYSKDQVITDEDHLIIHFMEDDCVIQNRMVPKTIGNVSEMFRTLLNGHLSRYVPYHEYYNIIMNNMRLNEMLRFPKMLLEALIGELFINENGEKLRRLGQDYGISASVDDIIQTAGTFNSMFHNDPNKSILINKGKAKEKQKQESKLEIYFKK